MIPKDDLVKGASIQFYKRILTNPRGHKTHRLICLAKVRSLSLSWSSFMCFLFDFRLHEVLTAPPFTPSLLFHPRGGEHTHVTGKTGTAENSRAETRIALHFCHEPHVGAYSAVQKARLLSPTDTTLSRMHWLLQFCNRNISDRRALFFCRFIALSVGIRDRVVVAPRAMAFSLRLCRQL